MNEHEKHKEHTFDAFCKRVLKNEAVNAHLELTRQSQREVLFSELSQKEKQQLQYIDIYAPERRTFTVLGRGIKVEVLDGALGRALEIIPAERRNIVLLAYLLGMTDHEISEQMGLGRSTVQYRRTTTLTQLRKILMEDNSDD